MLEKLENFPYVKKNKNLDALYLSQKQTKIRSSI